MSKRNSIQAMKEELAGYRHALHERPQTCYEEEFASDFVAEKLESWGIQFERGWAKTGIVATIEGEKNDSGKAIGLRADLDALDIKEQTGLPYESKHDGKMHACGHDGHTTILLGTAKYLSENPHFNGKVHLFFQPAEEGGNGAHKMIEEGLFKKYPCDGVYAVHNWPWLPAGKIGMRVGPIMAAVDEFHITVTGKGSHAAVPQNAIDPVVVSSHIVTALQSIVSRNLDPLDSIVISVTNLNAGTGAFNIIPSTATMVGTVRSFSNKLRPVVKERMETIITKIAEAFGAEATLDYQFQCDATINTAREIDISAEAARKVVGNDNVDTDTTPYMTGEDFGAMLEAVPGTYVYLGQGREEDASSANSKPLHHPCYDFNDDVLPIGIEYFVELAETYMPLEK